MADTIWEEQFAAVDDSGTLWEEFDVSAAPAEAPKQDYYDLAVKHYEQPEVMADKGLPRKEMFSYWYREIPKEDRPQYLQALFDIGKSRDNGLSWNAKVNESAASGFAFLGSIPQRLGMAFGAYSEDKRSDLEFYYQAESIRKGMQPIATPAADSSPLELSKQGLEEGLFGAIGMAPTMYAGGNLSSAAARTATALGAGAKLSSAAGAVSGGSFWSAVEYPGIYEGIKESGGDDLTAHLTAAVAAPAIAALEYIQVKEAAAPFSRSFLSNAKKSITKAASDGVKRGLRLYGSETGIEALQSTVEAGARQVASVLDRNVKLDNKEEAARLLEEYRQAALAMPFVVAPGLGVEGARNISERIEQSRLQKRIEALHKKAQDAVREDLLSGISHMAANPQLLPEGTPARAISEFVISQPEFQQPPVEAVVAAVQEADDTEIDKRMLNSPEFAEAWASSPVTGRREAVESLVAGRGRASDFEAAGLPGLENVEGAKQIRSRFIARSMEALRKTVQSQAVAEATPESQQIVEPPAAEVIAETPQQPGEVTVADTGFIEGKRQGVQGELFIPSQGEPAPLIREFLSSQDNANEWARQNPGKAVSLVRGEGSEEAFVLSGLPVPKGVKNAEDVRKKFTAWVNDTIQEEYPEQFLKPETIEISTKERGVRETVGKQEPAEETERLVKVSNAGDNVESGQYVVAPSMNITEPTRVVSTTDDSLILEEGSDILRADVTDAYSIESAGGFQAFALPARVPAAGGVPGGASVAAEAAETQPAGVSEIQATPQQPESLALTTTQSVQQLMPVQQVAGRAADVISEGDIIKTWEQDFGVPIRRGGYQAYQGNKLIAAMYKYHPEVVRALESNGFNLAVIAHEIAHHVDKVAKATNSITDPNVQNEMAGMDYEPLGRAAEGFAEFVRMYITNDQQLNNFQGHVLDWFENDWGAKNPDWLAKFQKARKLAKQWSEQGAFDRARAAMGRLPKSVNALSNLDEMFRNGVNRFYKDYKDQYHFAKLVAEEAERRGMDFADQASSYELLMAFEGSAIARAEMALKEGVSTVSDEEVIIGQPLSEALKQVVGIQEYEEASAYAWALFTIAADSRRPGYNTGLRLDDAKYIVDTIDKNPDKKARYDKFARGITEFNNSLLGMLLDAGVITQEDYDRTIDFWGDVYIPLHRIFEGSIVSPSSIADRLGSVFGKKGRDAAAGGGRMVNVPPALRRRSFKGSDRPIADIVDSTISRAVIFYNRAMKHRAALALYNEVTNTPGMGGWMDEVSPGKYLTRTKVKDILSQMVKEGFIDEEEAKEYRYVHQFRQGSASKTAKNWLAKRYNIDPKAPTLDAQLRVATSNVPNIDATVSIWKFDFSPNNKQRIVRLIIDGKPRLFEVQEDLFNMIAGLDSQSLAFAFAAFRFVNVAFKWGSVAANTAFGGQNPVRDYGTYQFQSIDPSMIRTMSTPLYWAAANFWNGVQRMRGKETNELIDLFYREGGGFLNLLGYGAQSITSQRQRMIGKRPWNEINPFTREGRIEISSRMGYAAKKAGHLMGSLLTNWTDVPPRLAEFAYVLHEHGYGIDKNGKIYNIATGVHELPPRYVLARAKNAAANSTYNYRRIGAKMRNVEAVLPFTNAWAESTDRVIRILNDTGREAVQAAKEGDLAGIMTAKRGKRARTARRVAVAGSIMIALEMMHWYLRHDDDDWKEQDAWIKDGYWSIGDFGDTHIKIGKPQSWAWVGNLASRGLSAAYERDGDQVTDYLGRIAMEGPNKIIDPAGVLGAGVGVLRNYDEFRDNHLEMPNDARPRELRVNNYTRDTSKFLGHYLPLSPIHIDYAFDKMTGGAYGRLVGAVEKIPELDFSLRDVPYVRGFVVNRHQKESIDRMYDSLLSVKYGFQREKAAGNVSNETLASKRLASEYTGLTQDIRSAEKEYGEYDKYVVGLARDMLGREPLSSNPNPLTGNGLPAAVAEKIDNFWDDMIETVALDKGRPVEPGRRSQEEFELAIREHESKRKVAEGLINKYRSSPAVQRAVDRLAKSKTAKDIQAFIGIPSRPGAKETPAKFQERRRRYLEKRNSLKRFLPGS